MTFPARRLISASAWLACIALAYAAGLSLRDGNDPNREQDTAAKFRARPTDALPGSHFIPGRGDAAGGAGGDAKTLLLQDRVRRILAMEELGPRQAAFIRCIENADSSDMLAIAELLKEDYFFRYDSEDSFLMQRWGVLDGAAALQWMEKNNKGRHAGDALTAWAASDPAGAVAWLRNAASRKVSFVRSEGTGGAHSTVIPELVTALLQGWAQRDPVAATAFLVDPANAQLCPPDRITGTKTTTSLATYLYYSVSGASGTKGVTRWLTALESMPNCSEELRSQVFENMSGEVIRGSALGVDHTFWTRYQVEEEGRVPELAVAFFRAHAGKPWCPSESMPDRLWAMCGGNVDALLDASARMGPDPVTGEPWFTPESVEAYREVEEAAAPARKAAREAALREAFNINGLGDP